MNDMLGSITDRKSIGLLKDLWMLRQALDVHCLISVNWKAIEKVGVGKKVFVFLEMSCQRLIVLYIGRIFEKEQLKEGAVKYPLDSIHGLLRVLENGKADVPKPNSIRAFVQKYGSGSDEDGLPAISAVVKEFRKKHCKVLRAYPNNPEQRYVMTAQTR